MAIRYLKVVPEAAQDSASGSSSVWRDIVLASVAVGLLFVGIAGGAEAPQHSSAEPRAPQGLANAESNISSQAQRDFVYFPSQYVNQGTVIEVDIPTF